VVDEKAVEEGRGVRLWRRDVLEDEIAKLWRELNAAQKVIAEHEKMFEELRLRLSIPDKRELRFGGPQASDTNWLTRRRELEQQHTKKEVDDAEPSTVA
jgi:hypothetical protein